MDVMCIGDLVVDIFVRGVSEVPARWTFTFPEIAQVHTGGDAVNTAIDLAKLGFSAGVIGKIGDDDSGEFLVSRMRARGVNTEGIVRDPSTSTSVCFFIIRPDRTEAYWYYRGSSLAFRHEDVNMDLARRAKIVLVTGSYLIPAIDGEPTAQVLKEVRASGCQTAVDPSIAIDGDWTTIEPVLPHTDIFLPNLQQAEAISGRKGPASAAEYFLSRGVGTVVIKMDVNGCFIKTKDEETRLRAYQIEPEDMAGVGDAFAAGYLAGALKGWPAVRCGRLANAVAALATSAMGCSAGVKGWDESVKFMETAPLRKS